MPSASVPRGEQCVNYVLCEPCVPHSDRLTRTGPSCEWTSKKARQLARAALHYSSLAVEWCARMKRGGGRGVKTKFESESANGKATFDSAETTS